MIPYAQIAIPLPVYQTFTYKIPESLQEEIAVGKRVLVPFGNRQMTGYLVNLIPSLDPNLLDPASLKEIIDVLDTEPILNLNLLKLTEWMADYYLCSWGEAIKATLPAGLDNLEVSIVKLNLPAKQIDFSSSLTLEGITSAQRRLLEFLQREEEVPLPKLKKKLGKKGLYSTLHTLEKRGLIEIERVIQPKVKPKVAKYIRLLQEPSQIVESVNALKARAPHQAAVLTSLMKIYPQDIAITELGDKLGFEPYQVVKSLEKTGWVATYSKEVYRDPFEHISYQKTQPLSLVESQAKALEMIKSEIDSGKFSTILLHGVTGSGKTEVYLQAIEYLLTKNQSQGSGMQREKPDSPHEFSKKQVIFLVPEISLTPLLVNRFLSRFGDRIAILHSRLSSGERVDQWQRIRKGEIDIVLGARSAIFAPVPKLGLVIVDEEHDPSYKQDSVPRYNGRDVAIMRAKIENAPAVLGSATPSLESFYNAQQGKYKIISLTERIDRRELPRVYILDMRKTPREANRIFSSELERAIESRLKRKEQTLLFLNRRGFATFFLCRECGFVYYCPRCSVTLTYHVPIERLLCHYCDFSRVAPRLCPACSGSEVGYYGVGTQKVEKEVRLLFPHARVARMDRDTMTQKESHRDILTRFENREIDILIGTQMIAKGHDFPYVTLVGIISAETMLHLPDFRASERTFQLLTQVAGRAGRGSLPGEVLVQTFTPSHYAILTAQTHDYLKFYEKEIQFRQQLRYPPFSRVVNIILQGTDKEFTEILAKKLAGHLRIQKPEEIILLGPTAAALAKLKGKYRYQILLKSPGSGTLRTFVGEGIEAFRKVESLRDVRITVDVDPVNLL
jgi:primosomal protein N' (replication factor Y)